MNKRHIITQLMRDLNIPANLQGYYMLRDALEMALDDQSILYKMGGRLYPEIAKKHDTLPSRIDRNMRYVVETVSIRDSAEFQRLFGRRAEIPTVSEFLATLTDELREFRMVGTEL
jgi:two-component system response regulator (stage 0 sporulation protein A)